MRRTEQLQGLRLMKFEDVYGRCYRGDLSQAEASEILGMSERTFRRWRDEAEGAATSSRIPASEDGSAMRPRVPRVCTTGALGGSRRAARRWTR